MTSQRPYLVRAIHEWISDNGMTPHLLVDANAAGVHVPPGTAKDGKVVLNIAERAVQQLSLGNEFITFGARFGGVAHEVFVPVEAVLAIYSRETGQGMALPDPVEHDDEAASTDASQVEAPDEPETAARRPQLSAVPASDEGTADEGGDPPPAEPGGGRPRLRVVK